MDYVDTRTQVEVLQDLFSDFHKDVHGFRPRFPTSEQWNSAEWLQQQIDQLHQYLELRKATFAQREQLREEGWHIPEDCAMCAAYAFYLEGIRETERKELYGEYA